MTGWLGARMCGKAGAWLVLAGFFLFAYGGGAVAQKSSEVAGTETVAPFDVVSIHLSRSSDGYGMLDNAHGKLNAVNLPLKFLIAEAYGLRTFQVLGASDWMDTLCFDIKAETDAAEGEAESAQGGTESSLGLRQQHARISRLQLQALLADRFGLKIHMISKVAAAFDLLVDKDGLKIKAVSEAGAGNWGAGKVEMKGVTLGSFTRALSDAAQLERLVFDKTQLSGYYNFSLKWTPDGDHSADSELPSLGDAMREQLGLQLRAVKEMVPYLVVDGAQKPSAN